MVVSIFRLKAAKLLIWPEPGQDIFPPTTTQLKNAENVFPRYNFLAISKF
jgi:hypothetical protein